MNKKEYPTKEIMMAMENQDIHTITKLLFRFLKESDNFIINNKKYDIIKKSITSIQDIKLTISKYKTITMFDILNIAPRILSNSLMDENANLIQIKYCNFIAQQIKPKHKKIIKNTLLELLQKHNITKENFIFDAIKSIEKQKTALSWRKHIANIYNIKTIDDLINNVPPTLFMWHTVMGNKNLMNEAKYDMIDCDLKRIFTKINYVDYLKDE